MHMLMMRKGKPRADGSRTVVPILRVRHQKYGDIKEEKPIKTRCDVLVCGAHGSGKSRWLLRYEQNAAAIWPARPVVVLRAVQPVGQWVDFPALGRWYAEGLHRAKVGAEKSAPTWAQIEAKTPELAAAHDSLTRETWAKVKAHERPELLIKYIEDTGAVVMMDDAHKLTSRKADVAVRAVRVAGICLSSASQDIRIPLTLRLAIMARRPQHINLKSEASYDVTSMLVWLMTLISLGAGAWQVAAVLGGMNMLGRGQRAARQD